MSDLETELEVATNPPERRWSGLAVPMSLVAVVLVAAAAWSYSVHREDVAIERAYDDVAVAASTAVAAVLSYRAESVQDDVVAAERYLTGDFLDYYSKLAADVVIPAVEQRGLSSGVEVVASSVVSATAENATALVYIDQTTTERSSDTPTTGQSSVRVELVNIDGQWLVSKLDTV